MINIYLIILFLFFLIYLILSIKNVENFYNIKSYDPELKKIYLKSINARIQNIINKLEKQRKIYLLAIENNNLAIKNNLGNDMLSSSVSISSSDAKCIKENTYKTFLICLDNQIKNIIDVFEQNIEILNKAKDDAKDSIKIPSRKKMKEIFKQIKQDK